MHATLALIDLPPWLTGPRGVIVLALAGFAVYLVWPAISKMIKDKAAGAPEDLQKLLSGEKFDVGKLMAARVVALRAACGKAPLEMLLEWIEKGFDADGARIEYVKWLESKVPADKPSPEKEPAK